MEQKLQATVTPVEEADAKALYANVEAVMKNNTKKSRRLKKKTLLNSKKRKPSPQN